MDGLIDWILYRNYEIWYTKRDTTSLLLKEGVVFKSLRGSYNKEFQCLGHVLKCKLLRWRSFPYYILK